MLLAYLPVLLPLTAPAERRASTGTGAALELLLGVDLAPAERAAPTPARVDVDAAKIGTHEVAKRNDEKGQTGKGTHDPKIATGDRASDAAATDAARSSRSGPIAFELAAENADLASPGAELADSPPDSEGSPAASSGLNLARPSEWDTLVESAAEPGVALFKRSDARRHALVLQDRRRAEALRQNQIERFGHAADGYGRQTGTGEAVKTDQGCFELREDLHTSGQQRRWWRTGCKDGRKPAWRRKILAFDGDAASDP
ncbi:MAG: hypothetical protein AAF515_12260 [Pseudomonadota bacterium]